MKKKVYICDFCGHYWYPDRKDKKNCGICGCGSRIILNSEEDVWRDLRNQIRWDWFQLKRRWKKRAKELDDEYYGRKTL